VNCNLSKLPSEIKVKVSVSELVGNVEELKDIKAKKNGEITVKELIRILLNELYGNEIEELVVVRKYKNGTVASGWTCLDGIIGLGMAEFLKMHMKEELI
jgi:hypothetical protein